MIPDWNPPPVIAEAYETFKQELPGLLDEHEGKWVAYSGKRRIGIADDKTELYRKCLALGIPRGEFIVHAVEEWDDEPTAI